MTWDGRKTVTGEPLPAALARQAGAATAAHLGGEPLSPAQRAALVAFTTALFAAQGRDAAAGDLDAAGARGGPRALAEQPFFAGINSSRAAPGFRPRAFTLFEAWAHAEGPGGEARRSVARGEAVFNERPFPGRSSTCTSCHNTPSAGSNSLGLFFDLGLSDESRRPPGLPLYSLRCLQGGRRVETGQLVRTTDPGLAMSTGRCDDIGAFKVPTLRGLAARPPYFHAGSAPTLEAVVEYYDTHFELRLTETERRDLAAFLRAL